MDDVRKMIAVAIRTGLDRDTVDDFLAAVDWSRHMSADPAVRESLGNIEGWATAYREGDMSLAEYVANLLVVLSHAESLAT